MNDVSEGVNRLRAEYDAAPYRSNSYPQSAPGHLAAIAHFFGLDVPDVAGARVLEIGCASGDNILPFAASHPEAHVLGIDLSGVHIEQGRQLVQALGVDNLDADYQLLITATDELLTSGTLNDDTLQALLDTFGTITTRKYVATIAWFTLLSLFLNGTRVPMETTDKIGQRTSPMG